MAKRLTALIAFVLVAVACSSSPGAPSVNIVGVRSGDEVTSPMSLSFRAEGLNIRAAGANRSGEAHFLLSIDAGCVTPGDTPVDDEAHRRLADGSDRLRLDLPPGKHDLCLQAVSGAGVALGITHDVTVYVDVEAPRSATSSSSTVTTALGGTPPTTTAAPLTAATTSTSLPGATTCPSRDAPAVGQYLRLNEYCDGMVTGPLLENITFQWGNGVAIANEGDYPMLIVDAPCLQDGDVPPNDEAHVAVAESPFQVEELRLSAGEHTLCAQLMDRDGTAKETHDLITITVIT